MAVNRGKDFEAQIAKAFKDVSDTAVLRLIDPQAGYAGVSNVCDYVVYHRPLIFFVECKSCYGNTLSIHSNNPKKLHGNITNTQWDGLLELSKTRGVVAGYIIWFIDHDITVFIDAWTLNQFYNEGKKSFHVKDADVFGMIIPGKKRRVLFDYNMEEFLTFPWEAVL